MRRLLRNIAAGKEAVGDTTTLEDYGVLAKLRESRKARSSMNNAVASVAVMIVSTLAVVAAEPTVAQMDMSCPHRRVPVEGRASPLDSVMFQVDGHDMKICYGRPSARGRTMIGGSFVPYGQLWRTGANEPTILHATAPVAIAGIEVPAGTYSLYTVPGEDEWQIIVNRAIDQWGHERFYTGEVLAQEVARARVPSVRAAEHAETFTISAERDGDAAHIVMAWETTRVRIPIAVRDER